MVYFRWFKCKTSAATIRPRKWKCCDSRKKETFRLFWEECSEYWKVSTKSSDQYNQFVFFLRFEKVVKIFSFSLPVFCCFCFNCYSGNLNMEITTSWKLNFLVLASYSIHVKPHLLLQYLLLWKKDLLRILRHLHGIYPRQSQCVVPERCLMILR